MRKRTVLHSIEHASIASGIRAIIMEDEFELVPNTKGKADTWRHFFLKKRKHDGTILDKVAVCKTCKSTIKTSGCTSNMTAHIRRYHPQLLSRGSMQVKSKPKLPATVTTDCDQAADSSHSTASGVTQPATQQRRQQTLLGAFAAQEIEEKKIIKYPSSSPRAKAITCQIARFLVKDLRPFSLVDSPHFRSLLETLDQRYESPSRNYFSDTAIPMMYYEVKAQVLANLQKVEQVALTTDAWTSRATKSYVTITAVLMVDWELISYVLQTRQMSESHTGENIARTITEAVQEWQLPSRLGLIMVSDNASNMTKAGKLLGCHIHLGCFVHTLNLGVQKALRVEGTAAILGRIRRVTSFFHRSTLAAAVLKSKAELLQMKSTTLKIDVCTRWNSAYDMLARFLELQAAVVAVIRSKEFSGLKEKEISNLNDEEAIAAEELVMFLKPLKDITTYMCSEELPTSSIIMPLLESLVGGNGHLCPKEGDSSAIEEMKTIMRSDLMNRHSAKEKEMLHLISSLDPRFKSFPYLSGEERDNIFQSLTDALVSLHQTKPTTVKVEPDTRAAPPLLDTSTAPPLPAVSLEAKQTPEEFVKVKQLTKAEKATKTPTCLLDTLLTDVYVTHVEPAKSTYQLVNEEVERFREEPDLKMADNPLKWWKQNLSRFPLLGRLAQIYLTVPATSVSSERVFSTAGDIVTAQRAALKSTQVDRLIFWKKNLK